MNLRVAAALLALALSACSAPVYNGVSLYAICAPPSPDETTGACLYPAACDGMLASTPVLDAATAKLDFRLPIQLDNALADNSSTAGINTNNATIQSFEVEYTGGPYLPAWSVNVNIRVATTGSTVYPVRLIPTQYFTTLKPPSPASLRSITLSVRAVGIFDSQGSFTTPWFQVPVEVCNGCLSMDFCPGGLLASCPSAAPGETSPGQTAAYTCLSLAAPPAE